MKNKKSITIAHLHVWDKKNKGDVAIVLAVQELLHQHFPEAKIIDYPVSLLKTGGAVEAKKINQADFIVIGGGGIFYSYFLPYSQKFIKQLKKPIIIFGAGYIREVGAPALSKAAASSVAYLAKQAILVGVRDDNTKKFLIDHGLAAEKIEVVGDPALVLSEQAPQEEVLKKLALAKGAIIPARDLSQDQAKLALQKKKNTASPIRIGLNLNYSGWLGFGKWQDDILGAYQAVIDYFQETYGGETGPGVEFYYLKHHPGESRIYPKLKIKNRHLVNLKPGEQKYVYGRLDLVIGMMLHVGVMAFGAETPQISVAYDLRNYSFAEYVKLPELVVNLEDLSQGALLARAQEVFKKRKKYGIIFKLRKRQIADRQAEFLIKAKKVLKSFKSD